MSIFFTPHNVSVCLRSMDVWYHIAASLDPPDILALRTTCSSLLMICKQRCIWLQAARKMCRSHGLFLPSFPFESMSVNELTRLALSPYNFSQLVSSDCKGYLPEVTSRTFRPRLKRLGSQVLEVRCLHLLPGGRYLLTYHDRDICLWDLGYGSASFKHLPVAYLHTGNTYQCYGEKPPCPTPDGKGIRFMHIQDNISEFTSTFRVYDFCPEWETPEFRCIASWQMSTGCELHAYSSRYAVVSDDEVVQVYAIEDAGMDGPRCSLCGIDPSNTKVVILGDTVLATSNGEDPTLNVFNIPRTRTSMNTQCLPHSLALPAPAFDNLDLISTSEWAASLGNDFFVLGGVSSAWADFGLYQMMVPAFLSQTELSAPGSIAVKVGKLTGSWSGLLRGPHLQQMTSDLAVIGISFGGLGVARIDMSSANASGEDLVTPSVLLTDEILYNAHDFYEEVSACVATGRVVVANEFVAGGNCEWVIRIIDYLSPAYS